MSGKRPSCIGCIWPARCLVWRKRGHALHNHDQHAAQFMMLLLYAAQHDLWQLTVVIRIDKWQQQAYPAPKQQQCYTHPACTAYACCSWCLNKLGFATYSILNCWLEMHMLEVALIERFCCNRVLSIDFPQVTNTPWGERVTFVFNPEGDVSPKALHVSPFMDMQNTW